MAYIGVSPSNGVRRVHTYTATASQTTFSGAGAEGTSLSYKDSNFVDVYQNGIKLGDADYTSTSGTSIVLAQGASVDDLVVVVVFDVFSVADTVSKADGGTFDGAVSFAGDITDSGDLTIDVAGDIILDADGGDVKLKDGGTEFANLSVDNGGLTIVTTASDADFKINGNDGGSSITALTLDMSEAGQATFNSSIVVKETVSVNSSSTSAFVQSGSDVFQFGTSSNDPMLFFTNNSEGMRLRSDGQVAINTTGGSAQFQVLKASGDIVYFQNTSGTGAKLTAGNQSFSAVSDENKKESIVELDKQQSYDNIKNIRAVTYKFKDIEITDDDGKKTTYEDDISRIGFIAQDWETKYSQLVNTDDDGVKSLLYTETTPVLLSALQKAQEKIEALEARITALEGK